MPSGIATPAPVGLGPPAGLEVERVGRHLAEVLDDLGARRSAEGVGIGADRAHGIRSQDREARRPTLGVVRGHRRGALEQPVDNNDRRPGQLVAPGDRGPDVLAVVEEELQVEPGRLAAGVAVAAGRLLDAPEPAAESDVRDLDRVEEQRPVGPAVLDEEERGVALELGQPERRLESPDHGFEEVTGDRRGMLDLAPREVRGVAGEVGDQEESTLGCRSHACTLDLGVTPMSSPQISRRAGWPSHRSGTGAILTS